MAVEQRKTIVVPMDFDQPSAAALEAAERLGMLWKARIEVVYVSRHLPPVLAQNAGSPEDRRELLRYYRDLRQRLQGAAGDYPWVGVRIEEGPIGDVLCRLAGSDPAADLLVMGTHGYTGLRRLLHRSLTEAVVHAARVPVLSVHGPAGPQWPRRILVPVKFASYADEAFVYALGLARLTGAETVCVHVTETGAGQDAARALWQHLERLVGAELLGSARMASEEGRPAEGIVRAARRENADLIVLAAHRKPFWGGLELGMTAQRVLRHSAVPVLSLPSASPPRGKLEDVLLARNLASSRRRHRK